MTDNLTRPPRNQTLFIWLCVASGLASLAVVPAAGLASVSLMAVGVERSVATSILFWTIWTCPIAIVAGPVLAWFAYGFRKERSALWLSLSPLAWVFTIGALVILPG